MRIKIPAKIPAGAARAAALHARLARRQWIIDRSHHRAVGRVSALDRVMRRATVHTRRAFGAHVRLLALLSGGVTRRTERVDLRQPRTLASPLHTIRQQLRVLPGQRVLHQHLIERLVRSEASTAPPRVSVVARVDQRQAAARIEMVMVRAQAPVATTSSATTTEARIAAPGHGRPDPAQPRLAPSAPPLVLPAQELSRVTDHVIRQLDHRVLSWQERTGWV